MIDDLRLRTITFQPFRDFEGMPPASASARSTRAERKFDVMEELGLRSPDGLLQRLARQPRRHRPRRRRPARAGRARRQRAACASPSRRWPGAGTSTTTATPGRRCAAPTIPAVGLVLDTFHILARGTDLSAIRSIPRDRIFLVQVADAPRLDMDYLSWSRHFRNFPGQGDLPLDRLHGGARRPPASTGCSRWRSSTTSSAPARRAASRSTAIARSSICSTGCTRAPARSLPA